MTCARQGHVDLPNEVAKRIFDGHVRVSDCSPTELWKLHRVTTQSLTSEWAICKANVHILASILEESQGFCPNQASFRDQFIAWIKEQGKKWSWKEADGRIWDLRVMLMSIQAIKRSKNPRAPPRFPDLQVLVDLCARAAPRSQAGAALVLHQIPAPTALVSTAALALVSHQTPQSTRKRRILFKHDIEAVELCRLPSSHPAPIVDLTSTSGDMPFTVTHDLDELDHQLFGDQASADTSGAAAIDVPATQLQPPSLQPAPSRKGFLDATALMQLAKHQVIGPSPQAYRDFQASSKRKKQNPTEKGTPAGLGESDSEEEVDSDEEATDEAKKGGKGKKTKRKKAKGKKTKGKKTKDKKAKGKKEKDEKAKGKKEKEEKAKSKKEKDAAAPALLGAACVAEVSIH